MGEIGVRELKTHASEIVRKVKEERARYVITHRGRPAALLIPIEETGTAGQRGGPGSDTWEELVRLGEEIAKGWQSEKSAIELLSEGRR